MNNQRVIGICGLIGSGKDTVGDELLDKHGYIRFSFAMVLKDMCAVLFDWDRNMLEGKTPETRALREIPDEWWSTKLGREWSPRIALQYIGTDIMRNHFHEDIWLNTVENRIRKHNKVVFTDCRFPNEIEFIKDIGELWVVERGERPAWYDHASNYNTASLERRQLMDSPTDLGVHESEWAWVGIEPDQFLTNNETLENLYTKIRNLA